MDGFRRLWEDIGTHGIMVLSTCEGCRVTSRSMSVVVYGGRFYFQTSENYLKYAQIRTNENVALCFGKYSIEGVCRDIGKPCEVSEFLDSMSCAYPDAVKRWSALPEERVLEVSPVLIRAWIYENDIPYIEEWDMAKGTYRKERQ